MTHKNWLDLSVCRRRFLRDGVSFSAGLLGSALGPGQELWAAATYPPQKRLVWINLSGGWDLLETVDPKPSSTSGIDMSYGWDEAQIFRANRDQRIGRWFPELVRYASDIVVVRGMNMGTTSHMAGSVYMDTGVLSNSGVVNAASLPSIVASESSDTIPIIQLAGGSDPRIDRGLLTPISVVRASNLSLYKSMYPQTSEEKTRKNLVLTYLKDSISRARARTGDYDRLKAVEAAQEKIQKQFIDDVGSKLALTDADRALFSTGTSSNTSNSAATEAFALALKLIRNNLVTCVNLGLGGFDTHTNQERNLQPILERLDKLLTLFIRELKAIGEFDKTLIALYSDFGRTPKINSSNGRDHWPVGGAMLIGGGIEGGRVVGGTDDNLRALPINPDSGEVDSTSSFTLSPVHLCGSVLALTLGETYTSTYRSYLTAIPALTKLRGGT